MNKVVADRDILENILREALQERVVLTKQQVKEIFKEFVLYGISNDTEIVGCILLKENEIHVAVLKSFRKRFFTKKLFKQVATDVVKEYGSLKTKVLDTNTIGLDFITKLGFKKEGDWYVYTPNRFLS
jgi:N-acetylglutamate synthase-like GNAT family acetyltransferase